MYGKNSKTIKFDFDINLFKTNNYSKKCENKICSIIVDDPSKIFPSKFYASSSFKSQILNLCEKCYIAYKNGNYCYYCNIVYRDFDFNTSYYDKLPKACSSFYANMLPRVCTIHHPPYHTLSQLRDNSL